MTENQKKQIDECRDNGLTISAIADVTGLSVSAIKSYCSRRNNSEQPSDPHCKFCGAELTQTEKHRQKHQCGRGTDRRNRTPPPRRGQRTALGNPPALTHGATPQARSLRALLLVHGSLRWFFFCPPCRWTVMALTDNYGN